MKTKGQKISESWTRKSMILIRRAQRASRQSLGYIVGVIASDGCVVQKKKGPSRIEMKTVNRSFAELFYKRLLEVFGKASCYTKRNTSQLGSSRRRHPFVWQVELSDKLVPGFIEALLRNSKILGSDKLFKIGFLQGLFDGDGYVKRRLNSTYLKKSGQVSAYKRPLIEGIGLTSGDRDVIRVVQVLFESFGIGSVYEDTTPTCARVMLYGKSNIEKFSKLIGFRVDYRASRLKSKVSEA